MHYVKQGQAHIEALAHDRLKGQAFGDGRTRTAIKVLADEVDAMDQRRRRIFAGQVQDATGM